MQATNYYRTGLDVGSTTAKMVILDNHRQVVFSRYERHNAQVNRLLETYFREAREQLGDVTTAIAVTGSVGMGTAEQLQAGFVQEVVAATRYAQERYPEASALIDIGGEDAKVVLFQGENIDLRMNGNCAGGTGAFIDQMAVWPCRPITSIPSLPDAVYFRKPTSKTWSVATSLSPTLPPQFSMP